MYYLVDTNVFLHDIDSNIYGVAKLCKDLQKLIEKGILTREDIKKENFKKKDMENGYLKQTIGAPQKNYCHLLIAHNPDYFEDYARWGADLVLSGHVHGGIMRLPLLGGVIAPSYTLFPKYDGGVFYEGNATMLLGRGLGSHTLPFRFFNPAELYEVQLLPKQ
jgi:hypothetical protein